MNLNVGQVIERVVRRDHMGISELARKLNVSRRTIYNWFDQEALSLDIVSKIGRAIGHDFSLEFPDEFAQKSNNFIDEFMENPEDFSNVQSSSVHYWINKYIKLLEKYNELLSQEISKPNSGKDILYTNHLNGNRNNILPI